MDCNAIAEALYMTALERNGDVVQMASYAPLLAKNNFTQWKTDMIFFDNHNICLTPNYYVQQLFFLHQGDYYYDNIIQKDARDSTLAASCVQDSKTGDIILKLVNVGKETKVMTINLSPFKKFIPEAEQIILAGDAANENTLENPGNIILSKSSVNVRKDFKYSAPAMSLTVIRIKTKS